MSKLPLIGVPSLRVSHPGGLFLDLDSEFNHTDNDGKNAQSHASELAFGGRDHLLPPPWHGDIL